MEIKTVAVIGANGTMGTNVSAVFAAFGSAKVYMVSRDRDSAVKARERAFRSVRAESIRECLIPASYEELSQIIPDCDLVFESAAENWEVKVQVTGQIIRAADRHKNKHTVFCTGTSGLSITGLAELYPEDLRPNYMGVHMFNPPYQMTLCEVTPSRYTDKDLLEEVKQYCARTLYRTVAEVKDSPAFLGNRIGFQFMNKALQYAAVYKDNGGIDYIDSILGPFTGRTMPPLRTADFVGLDVHKAIVDNLYENTSDFAHADFEFPGYAAGLVEQGFLGKKAGQGLYKTVIHDNGTKIYQVYDIASGTYRDVMKYTFPFAERMVRHLKRGEYQEAFLVLVHNHSAEAKLCLHMLLKYLLYSLSAGEEVGYSIHSADDVMAAGFNWCPPLALAEGLSKAGDLRELCRESLKGQEPEWELADGLLGRLEASAYDFRRYIRAKR